ncbi:phage terminase large subunit [Globicatella sp. PHS-GS-PNBC-21-1553]|uniref:phage terminase large subunit n=1 Tax=Globicatella sp. PHS-GS-PNBC-21-1553 TaxID=2885764 RepID=UPI00298F2B11|nr:phage terminase large subunit [Globicatella sp. PHS-GS-PNBC-21-1553]WPC08616.1 phage terminase large subunit [Globicatella sp. PHS-GS-PNBC-21-1553]
MMISQKRLKLIKLEAKKELARREFFAYCNLMAGDFYSKDREFLVNLCNDIQSFIDDSEQDILIINLPPRHGKSRTASLLATWLFGRDNKTKIMTGSYNERLSSTFAKGVRNMIATEKVDNNIVFNDVFPNTKIKYGDASASQWSLEGSEQTNYLATSPSGTATGFGASVIIIDDLIKNAEEANNARVLEDHWTWFTDTMLSRLEAGGKIILIMTRWNSKDLAGRALQELPHIGYRVKHINLKAQQDDGSMLCDDILSADDYEKKVKVMSPEIASANYQQQPIDLKGRLYQGFETYDIVPEFERIEAYVDTADTGKDKLVALIYGIKDKQAYMIDYINTNDPMEITEPLLANKLILNQVNVAHIESNNGGRGFARNVERIMKEKGSNRTVIKWFHQTKNKEARILSASAWVQVNVLFPTDWEHSWRDLYDDLMSYQREGKNKHDDAPDAITGIYDKMNNQGKWLV